MSSENNAPQPRKVVSVSLGSSSRDHQYCGDFLGQTVEISRIGHDGNFRAAQNTLRQLDGQVDAIGLGGVDISLRCKDQRYFLRDGLRLAQTIQKTPVVDGSGLKDTLEKEMIRWLSREGHLDFSGQTVLLASALDRYAMAEAVVQLGAKAIFADKIFALGLDEPIYSLDELEQEARRLLPDLVKMPISMLYPVGKSQTQIEPTSLTDGYFEKASIIAGDFHIIRRRLPDDLAGKTLITNTVTSQDIQELQQRRLQRLITSTPELAGRSFGTNVLEAVFVALISSRIGAQTPNSILDQNDSQSTSSAYLSLMEQLQLRPRLVCF